MHFAILASAITSLGTCGRSFEELELSATAYLDAAVANDESADLQALMLQVDVEVLKLYSLPIRLERVLLDLFSGYTRVGVPFDQNGYFPTELDHPMRLSDFLRFENDWPASNRERGEFIDKRIAGTLDDDDQERLDALQAYADYYIEKTAPRPTHVLDELEDRLFASTAQQDKDI